MNKEDIIRMAIEAGWDSHQSTFDTRIKAFAALVASAEREACAKECEGINSVEDYYGERLELVCAQAIRARGQA